MAGSVGYWVRHGWLPADTAGWVQAFGSIGAILVAFWISQRQSNAAQLERERRDIHYMVKLLAVTSSAVVALKSTAEFVQKAQEDKVALKFHQDGLIAVQANLLQFEYVQIVDDGVADSWMSIKSSVHFLLSRVEMGLIDFASLASLRSSEIAAHAQENLDNLQNSLGEHCQKDGTRAWRPK